MAKPGAVGERAEQVAEHGRVGGNLLAVDPAGEQPRLLIERGVDEVGDLGQVADEGGGRVAVGEIDLTEVDAGRFGGPAPGNRDDARPRLAGEAADAGRADEARGAGD